MDPTEAIYNAAEDWNFVSRSALRRRCWGTWPKWGAPPGSLRLVLHPKRTNERRPAQLHGLGVIVALPKITQPREMLLGLRRACRL
eukprot:6907633-Pyramimonas_sp.AAC.1